MNPQVGQLYQHVTMPQQVIMVTRHHDTKNVVMTVGMNPNTKNGWRSTLALRLSWRPLTQENK
jgi:hypothetical protein